MSKLYVPRAGQHVQAAPYVWDGDHYARPISMHTLDGAQYVELWKLDIEFDGTFVSAYQSNRPSPVAFSWTHDVGDDAYLIVVLVGVWGQMQLAADKLVTVGDVRLDYLGGGHGYNGVSNGWLAVFGGKVPPGLHTVQVNLTQAGKVFYGWGSSYSYSNAKPAGGLVLSYGWNTNPTLMVPSAPGRMVWSAFATGTTGASAFSGTTRRTLGTVAMIAGDTQSVSDSTVSSAAISTSTAWVGVGLDLKISAS